jgi:hypothetical protein
MTTPQHDDPFGDGASTVLQALAVLTTVGEAAARFAAAAAQNRAAKADRHIQLGRVTMGLSDDRAARWAYTAAQRADRALMDRAFDDDWLAAADLGAVANLWRTAALYANSGDRRAGEAMHRAQNRLAQLNPGLMTAFGRHRASGRNLADAMRAAGQDVWAYQTRSPTWTPGNAGDPVAVVTEPTSNIDARASIDELAQARRVEVARLAAGADPAVLATLQRQWRGAGHVTAADAAVRLANAAQQAAAPTGSPAASAAEAEASARTLVAARSPLAPGSGGTSLAEAASLAGDADQLFRRADIESSQPDIEMTAADEHVDAQAIGARRRGQAEHDQAAAAQQRRLGQAFRPLGPITARFSHASPPPADPAAIRRRGTTR